MKYEKEYQEFAKQITDKFILMVTGECIPEPTVVEASWCPEMEREATQEEKDLFYKERNECALKWLNKNMISYDKWLINHTKRDTIQELEKL